MKYLFIVSIMYAFILAANSNTQHYVNYENPASFMLTFWLSSYLTMLARQLIWVRQYC